MRTFAVIFAVMMAFGAAHAGDAGVHAGNVGARRRALPATRPAVPVATQGLARQTPTTARHWIWFSDRGPAYTADQPTPTADEVYAPYVERVRTVATVHMTTRWLNGVSVAADIETLEHLRALPFVRKVEPVASLRKPTPAKASVSPAMKPGRTAALDYGTSFGQIHAINADSLHLLGFDGTGIRIAILDNGFDYMTHPAFSHLKIANQWDFIDSNSVVTGGTHGQQVLSTTGAYAPGQLIGSAWNATYLLARTENNDYELPIEEDNWLHAAEWAWDNGAHVINTSVGYDYFDDPINPYQIDKVYAHDDMDGKTTVITKAAQAAAARGIVVVCVAGNEATDPLWANPDGSMSLLFPADGDLVITVGNMNTAGTVASSSSRGPTADGRIKPDICAVGSSVRVTSGSFSYTYVNGTSFASPTTAGIAALLLQAHPTWDPIAVRTALRMSGDHWDRPDNSAGWGMIDAMKAFRADSAVFGRVTRDGGSGVEPASQEHVWLFDSFGNEVTQTSTSAEGWFRFEHIPPGTYTITCAYLDEFADTTLSLPMLPREIHLQMKERVSVTSVKPSAFTVSEGYPNPANPGTAFRYTLPAEHARTISLRIYSITGQVVWRQATPASQSGMLTWHGRTWSGREAASGVYLARIECGAESTVKRVILVR